MYDWDFGSLWPYAMPLLRGLLITTFLSIVSIVLGTMLGLVLVVARRARHPLVRYPAALFIEVFLAMPVLVLLIWMYYCLPLLLPIRVSGTWTAVVSFSLSLGAFVAETIRSGIDAIPQGQIDAAKVLQMPSFQIYRFIIFPQALRTMLPALLTQYLTCLKLSTLASVIAVYELLHTANNVASRTYRPLEVYTAVAVLFLGMVLPINALIRCLERRWGVRIGVLA